ncbi:aspartate aminotransferase family protein [Chromobacterium phragmitis]|uniref:Aspartate aminotransferase family protein n=1 Tax=Chromobacterium phragmitis TaxID=2202141 RepID=A0A344UC92_9NEIS|nr:aspartate aminotransferase family protein [Chromobacterium phragmitis]AXE31484.1 aspartate aminotransferase family protein [Chromobacterium phragmitis]AXE32890.1 aspartate aminotransferase family protein [Chromobacterium phragmitis]
MQKQRTTSQWRELDAAHHLHPFTDTASLNQAGARVMTRGEGVYLWDSDGNKIIDGMAGLWCVNVGYGRKDFADVARRQMEELPFYNTFFKTTHPAVVELSSLLAEVTPAGFDRVFYTNSGSESVDTMIRMVRRYWDVQGKPEKKTLIGRWNGYHGSTIGGASLGGMKYMHEQGDLPIPGMAHIEQPWWYKHGKDMTPDEFGLVAARWLEEKILEIGPDKVAAFVGEPIQGAGGVIIPPASYWPEIERICRKYDVLIVADEVICGFGRTGEWFGFQQLGFQPDIFTTAKGLSSGYLPIGAVFVGKRVAEGLIAGGDFNHGFTYSGHPVCAAVAHANVAALRDEGIVQRVKDDIGPYMQKRWRETFSQFEHVDDVRGVGMIQAFTLVKNKSKRELFADFGEIGTLCRDIFFRNNLIMRACGDHIVSAPPLVMTRAEVDAMLAVAARCLEEFEQTLKARGLA